MKKGHVVLAISLVVLILGFIGIVNAVTGEWCGVVTPTWSPTGCVCGELPNSSQGYGQIIIGGSPNSTVISCNNAADGICPEDFVDVSPPTPLVGNCSNCIDPDCTVNGSIMYNGTGGYVDGYVTDSSGKPIAQALVIGHAIKWNESVNLEISSPTNDNGVHNSTAFIAGKYYFSASKDGYDTQLVEDTVPYGAPLHINFQLNNGTCHSDCTNSYNRCNAMCDGATFSNNTASCNFYNSTVRDKCNNKLKGTEVELGPIAGTNSSAYVSCCEGSPFAKYYYTAFVDGNNIKNLIKTEKIARYNDVPVRIVVAYW